MATLEIHHIPVLGDGETYEFGAETAEVFAEIRRRKDHFRGTRVGRT